MVCPVSDAHMLKPQGVINKCPPEGRFRRMGGACLGRMTFDGGGHVQAAQRDTDFDGVNWFQAEWLMGVSGFRRNGPPSLPEMLGATVFRRQRSLRNMRNGPEPGMVSPKFIGKSMFLKQKLNRCSRCHFRNLRGRFPPVGFA